MAKRPARHESPPSLFYTVFPTPVGLAGAVATNKGLCLVKFNFSSEGAFLKRVGGNLDGDLIKSREPFQDLIRQLDLYFSGKLKRFSCRLDLTRGTAFQQKVWRQLKSVPYGTTKSYRWLSQAINQPKACRAVGNANGKNPISVIIPCHRIIRENGELGGYTGGLHIKRFLLNLEKSGNGSI